MSISQIVTNSIANGAVVQADLATGVAGTGPAFSAYGGAQILTTAVATKIANNTEVFDTNNNFDSITNYRFTPTVPGYYQVTAAVRDSTGATVGALNISIYKNGSAYSSAQFVNSNQGISAIVTSLIYMNGSTDYVEQYVTPKFRLKYGCRCKSKFKLFPSSNGKERIMPYIGNPIYQSAFVTDTFSGNGTTTAFTMSVAPAGTTNVLVAVSGVLQDPSTYGVVGTTLNFSAAPPSGTGNISVRYLGVPATGVTTTAYRTVTEFTATAGQTTFTPPSYTVGFIDVYRNGVMLGSADYTATNGTTVVLVNPATAGDLVETISFLVSSVLNAIPNTAGSVGSANIANDVTINFADGSAAAPSITNNGDTNTGMFFPAADTIAFSEGGVESMRIDASGNVLPGANGTQNLGSASLRWANLFTSDLHLNNGIGNYTIVEGEEDLFLYNNKSGKTFKFALIEVDPSTVPAKMKE
jgi:hypothetical protein